MKIGIVTQPLFANYGGLLQNYALQQVLKRLGHEPMTIDYLPPHALRRYVRSLCRWLLQLVSTGKWRAVPSLRRTLHRPGFVEEFMRRNIVTTGVVHAYTEALVGEYGLQALVTGSDQVWRPRYNKGVLTDMFLRFAARADVRRMAYAASFGVDGWEFSPQQTQECARLARLMDAVSVRESSGIALCREHLGVEAVVMPDPTLLLQRADYEALCTAVPRVAKAFVAAYVLDKSAEKQHGIRRVAWELGLPVKRFSAHGGMTLTVEEWLAMFRDAAFVVTDSFHGTVFSILFHKPFVALGNAGRGMARFQSLLSGFGLERRLCEASGVTDLVRRPVDWSRVDGRLEELRGQASGFLKVLGDGQE